MARTLKKTKWLIFAFCLVVALTGAMLGCGGGKDSVKITFDKAAVTIEAGNSTTVTATVEGSEETPEFTSSDEAVVTVKAGTVKNSVVLTGVEAGTAKVTAKVGDTTADIDVTVTAAKVNNALAFINGETSNVAQGGVSFAKGETDAYTAYLRYSSEDGTAPTVTADAAAQARFTVGELTATDTKGVSKIVITPKADAAYGYGLITVTLGELTVNYNADICSPGIILSGVSATSATAIGVSRAFTDGELWIPNYAYSEDDGVFASVTKIGADRATPNNATDDEEQAINEENLFGASVAVTKLMMGDRVTRIGHRAFYGGSLESVTIGKGVTSIGNATFQGNGSLTELNFAADGRLTTIESAAFYGIAVEELNIPDTVTTTGGQCFGGNTYLRKVYVSKNWEPTVNGLLDGCCNIEEVELWYTSAPIPWGSFRGNTNPETEKYDMMNPSAYPKVIFHGTKAQFRAMDANKQIESGTRSLNNGLFDCQNVICNDGIWPSTLVLSDTDAVMLREGRTADITLTGTNINVDAIELTIDEETATAAIKSDNAEEGGYATEVVVTVTGVYEGNTTLAIKYDNVNLSKGVTVAGSDLVLTATGYMNVGKGTNLTVGVSYSTEPTISVESGSDKLGTPSIIEKSEPDDGVISATISIPATDYGKAEVKVSAGSKEYTLEIEVCTPGLMFRKTINGESTEGAALYGFSAAVELADGDDLILPEFAIVDGEKLTVKTIGTYDGANDLHWGTDDARMAMLTYSEDADVTFKDFDMPENITGVWRKAFVGVSFSGTFTVGKGLSRVSSNSFEGITANVFKFDESVATVIGGMNSDNVFNGCNFDTFYVSPRIGSSMHESHTFAKDATIQNVIFDDSISVIGSGMFTESNVYNVTLPAVLTSIGDAAFSSTKLTSVTIPDGVTLGNEAFSHCETIRTVTLGKNVTMMYAAFYNNPIEELVLPEGAAFNQGSSTIGIHFGGSSGCLRKLTFTGNIAANYEGTFSAFFFGSDGTSLKEVVLDSTVTKISAKFLDGASAIEQVTFYGTQAQWDALKAASGDIGSNLFEITPTFEAVPLSAVQANVEVTGSVGDKIQIKLADYFSYNGNDLTITASAGTVADGWWTVPTTESGAVTITATNSANATATVTVTVTLTAAGTATAEETAITFEDRFSIVWAGNYHGTTSHYISMSDNFAYTFSYTKATEGETLTIVSADETKVKVVAISDKLGANGVHNVSAVLAPGSAGYGKTMITVTVGTVSKEFEAESYRGNLIVDTSRMNGAKTMRKGWLSGVNGIDSGMFYVPAAYYDSKLEGADDGIASCLAIIDQVGGTLESAAGAVQLSGVSGITDLYLGTNVFYIGNGAFKGASSLKNVTFEQNVYSFETSFQDLELDSVTISNPTGNFYPSAWGYAFQGAKIKKLTIYYYDGMDFNSSEFYQATIEEIEFHGTQAQWEAITNSDLHALDGESKVTIITPAA